MIRPEIAGEASAISALIREAFRSAKHSDGSEAEIVERLRAAEALTLSLVAEEGDRLAGHVAFSPVMLSGRSCGWYGLGPLAVREDRRRQGIGAALVQAGLDRLRRLRARGCVLVGDPAYYNRFGFVARPAIALPGFPEAVFLSSPLVPDAETDAGAVSYHAAFGLV